ncbi:mandelate racemase/muconate lactonizing enzyme family protein [Pseudooceanicola spongiae]|uniref:Mandelate racemase/muconate lactonizing enzyme family protein n=1 Tax=Pseudooceanicola spongiae TaxID=2613965 RepID=A0A7L9WRQ4_9RHOB|nr:mandelate racemase/muconate lactonizing enzyme family protein [Pseudooceanicola spongiae]QOL82524.1 mandelate racemase/muconate lactonizing enzyme family protein [Pseudooceanicola spongiae]
MTTSPQQAKTRIESFSVSIFRVPLAKPWVSAAHAITHHEHILVEVTLEGGLTGTGWCSTMGNAGMAVAALARSYLGPMLIGRDVHDHEALWNELWRRSHQPGPGGIAALAVAGFDLALWDLRGKLAGLPVRKLIGGAADSLEVYASAVNLHLSEAALVEQTRGFLEAGNRLFKIKVGRPEVEDDLSRIAAVRKVIGNRPLMLDANQRFKPGEALRRITAYARFDPVWMEEPMASDDVDGHARLASVSPTPIALGEEVSTRYEFWRYVSSGAVHYLQPNVLKVGGITEWLKIAHLGNCANLTIAPHGALEASVIVAAAIPGCYPVENIDGGSFMDQGIAHHAAAPVYGKVILSDAPGLGVDFDRAALAPYAAGPDTVVPLANPAAFYGSS